MGDVHRLRPRPRAVPPRSPQQLAALTGDRDAIRPKARHLRAEDFDRRDATIARRVVYSPWTWLTLAALTILAIWL